MMNRTISRVLLFTRGLHNGLHLLEPLLLVLVALGAFPLIFHLSELAAYDSRSQACCLRDSAPFPYHEEGI